MRRAFEICEGGRPCGAELFGEVVVKEKKEDLTSDTRGLNAQTNKKVVIDGGNIGGRGEGLSQLNRSERFC